MLMELVRSRGWAGEIERVMVGANEMSEQDLSSLDLIDQLPFSQMTCCWQDIFDVEIV